MSAVIPAEAGFLLDPERSRLSELEAVVERGLTTFVEVGQALMEIRDSRLYREEHPSFEAYCRERWGWSRVHAHRHIEAARVAAVLPIGNTPVNEAQARELAPLLDRPEQLREAWEEASADGKPTADTVREAVAARRGPGILGSSASNEWYTPAEYVESARRVLGGIDLDPASCEQANAVVKAARFYTERDDGLAQEWRGRVFTNPPYGQLCPLFMNKLRAEYEAGNVAEAVALVSAYSTETRWFQPLFAYPICFPDHRLRGWPNPTFGSAFVYLGSREAAFVAEFAQYGPIVKRIA